MITRDGFIFIAQLLLLCCSPIVLTIAEVARRTGRTHQAVSQAVQRGVPLEDMLARPKGSLRADARPGRRGRFSHEANTSAIVLALGVSRDALTRLAERRGSLLAAAAELQLELLAPMLLEGLGPPERMPGQHEPRRFISATGTR